MQIAFGTLTPDTRTPRVNGRERRFHAPTAAIAHGIVIVQRHFSLIPAFTAVENFALGGRGASNLGMEYPFTLAVLVICARGSALPVALGSSRYDT